MEFDPSNWGQATNLVHGGVLRSGYMETSEAIFSTSGFVYQSAEEAEIAFSEEVDRFKYSRYANPTVSMFVERLRLLENAEACCATASGMSAIYTTLVALLEWGGKVVANRSLFGSTLQIFDKLLPKFHIETLLVDGTAIEEWDRAISNATKVVFIETPSNPTLQLVDIEAISELAHKAGATVVVDNVFATPLGQSPLSLGADVVVYSATKHIDGQGRCLGGAILGSKDFCVNTLTPYIRHTGPSLSPFNAWVLLKGLETLPLRVRYSSASALRLAEYFQQQPRIKNIYYPFLDSHPQNDLAKRQMTMGGNMIAIEIEGGKEAAYRVLNNLNIVLISINLGDSKSLATHPVTTTHRQVTKSHWNAMDLSEGTIRISVGLEETADLIRDFDTALHSR